MGRSRNLGDSASGLKRTFVHLGPFLKGERGLIAGSLFALLAEVMLRLLEPWPLKVVFDRVVTPGQRAGHGLAWLDSLDGSTILLISAAAIVTIALLRAVASYSATVGLALVGNRVLTTVRNELYVKLQRLSLSFHSKARSGDLVVRVISDVGLLKDVAVSALFPMAANVLVLTGMIGVMFWMNVELALLALAVVPLFSLSAVRLTTRIHATARRVRQREGALAASTAESIGAIRTIKAYSLEPLRGRAFASVGGRGLRDGVQATRLEAALERTVDVLIGFATALVVWRGAVLVSRAALTPGDLLVFLSYFKNAFRPIRDFAKYAGRFAKAAAAGERVIDLLEQVPDVEDAPDARPAPRLRGDLRFDNVSFAYEPGRPALHNIDLSVAAGQHVAIVGPSGSGKSTLMNLVFRMFDPDQGRVLLDGHDIRAYTFDSVRGQIAAVLQETMLFAATVQENIGLGAPDATPEAIEQAARVGNAHEFITAMPDGYETVIGERGVTLSAGQRQRIAIARAAIRNAPILVLDEPTTGLDEHSERAVMDALHELGRDRTVLLVTHELRLAVGADLIVYIGDGRIVEMGTHNVLVRSGGAYASAFLQQTAGGFQPSPHSYAVRP